MNRTLIPRGARCGKSALAARFAPHREHRPADLQTVEEAVELAARLRELCAPDRLVLADCLTPWLTNLMFPAGLDEPDVGPVGLTRQFMPAFIDAAGRLNQAVAARCDRVLLVAAGLPLALKGPPL